METQAIHRLNPGTARIISVVIVFCLLAGVFYGLGQTFLAIIPLLLLMVPLKGLYWRVLIVVNALILVTSHVAFQFIGYPEFTAGISYFFQHLINSLAPLLIVLLWVDGGKYSKWLLIPMIPSAIVAPTFCYFSFLVVVSYSLKSTRVLATVIALPFFISFPIFGVCQAYANINCLTSNRVVGLKLEEEISSNGDRVRVYVAEDQSAFGSIDILIRREHDFIPGLILVKKELRFERASKVELKPFDSKNVYYKVGTMTGCI